MLPNAPLLPLLGVFAVLAAWPSALKPRLLLGGLLALVCVWMSGRTTLGLPLYVLLGTLPVLLAPRRWRLGWAVVAVLGLSLASLGSGRVWHETLRCQAQAQANSGQGRVIDSFPHPQGREALMGLEGARITGRPRVQEALSSVHDWALEQGAWRAHLDEPSAAGTLRLSLLPGPGVSALEIYLSPDGSFDPSQRALSLRRLPVDRAHQGELEVELDPREILAGSWDAAAQLAAIEIVFIGGPGEVTSATLLSEAGRYDPVAGVALVERDGVIHPAWTLRSGAQVERTLRVPQGASLVWSGAGDGRALYIGQQLISRSSEAGWTQERVDLSPWEGRSVTLRLIGEGPSVSFVGALSMDTQPQESVNVLVVMVDTLRADALSVYGAQQPTPSYDALAGAGARFAQANSASCWTKPSIPSLMSGIYPTTHQVGAQTLSDRMPDTVPLMQERFGQAGWATGSFSASPLGSTLSGLERGFDTAMPPRRWGLDRSAGQTPPAAALYEDLFAWWGEQDRPVFAYLHTLDVHQYYLVDGVEARTWPAYQRAVADSDALLGELMARLERSGHAQDTVVVLVSDHGESFWDHGLWSHGTGLAASQTQVPFVIWAPERIAPQVIGQPVSLIDLAPTLLDLAGLEPLPQADGQSLRALLEGGEGPEREGIYAALLRFTWTPGAPQQFAMIARDGSKLWDNGTRTLHFQPDDPCEGTSTTAEQDNALQAWRVQQEQAALDFAQAHGQSAGVVRDGELELLRALGYVE